MALFSMHLLLSNCGPQLLNNKCMVNNKCRPPAPKTGTFGARDWLWTHYFKTQRLRLPLGPPAVFYPVFEIVDEVDGSREVFTGEYTINTLAGGESPHTMKSFSQLTQTMFKQDRWHNTLTVCTTADTYVCWHSWPWWGNAFTAACFCSGSSIWTPLNGDASDPVFTGSTNGIQ